MLYSMVCGRDVDVEPRGTSYDRTVGLIRVAGTKTSAAMVVTGAPSDYVRYDFDPAIASLEAEARRQGRGLLSDPAGNPTLRLAA